MLGVLSASYVNDYGANHWKTMGLTQVGGKQVVQHCSCAAILLTSLLLCVDLLLLQNYFDKFGVFCSCLISAPLILMSFGILLYAVARASSLLIQVKRKELAKKREQKSAAAATDGAARATTTTTTTRVQSAEGMSAGDVDGDAPPAAGSSAKQRKKSSKKET